MVNSDLRPTHALPVKNGSYRFGANITSIAALLKLQLGESSVVSSPELMKFCPAHALPVKPEVIGLKLIKGA